MAKKARRRAKRPPIDLATLSHKALLTVVEFCLLHSICRATLANYEKSGIGPRVTRIGGRVFISQEAAAEWRRQIEANPLPRRGRPRAQLPQHAAGTADIGDAA
jgi:hypothetical protein